MCVTLVEIYQRLKAVLELLFLALPSQSLDEAASLMSVRGPLAKLLNKMPYLMGGLYLFCYSPSQSPRNDIILAILPNGATGTWYFGTTR